MPNYFNPHSIPEEVCSIIRKVVESDTHGRTDSISATELVDAPLQRVLRQRMWEHVTLEYSEQIWALLGSAIHYMLSLESQTGILHEYRMHQRHHSGLNITGKADRICAGESTGIQDWKVTSVWSFIFKNALASWEKQLNIYSWLCNSSAATLGVYAFLRDHSTTRANLERLRGNSEYPLIPFKAVAMEPWTRQEANDYVDKRVLLHTAAQETDRIDRVAPCTPEERWHKVKKFALRKETAQRARKLFDTREEAEQYACDNSLVQGHVIEPRGEESTKCARFCDYRAHHGCEALCPYFHRFVPDYTEEEEIV